MMKTKAAVFVVLGLTLITIASVNAAVYTRWGRTVCDGDSSALYTGYMVTEYIAIPGGGRNMLCLADTPQWGNVVNNGAPKQYLTGFHGVQYWFGPGYSNNNPFSYANYNNQDIYQRTAPCVVCTNERLNIVMIPGWLNCPSDMTNEYSGYIVANHYQNNAGEYICLDQAPEVAKAGGTGNGEAILTIGEIRCGALPCPPYVNTNQVSCAVCSI